MQQRFTLLARVRGNFIPVEVVKGTPIAPAGVSSYYVRFTEDGKRTCRPLGKDLAGAFLVFRNMEIAREFKRRDLPVPVTMMAVPATGPSRSLKDSIAKYSEEIKDNKARKTWLAYANSLVFFAESCKRQDVAGITREDLLAFKIFLRGKNLSERSIYNNFLNVMVFLKWCDVKTGIKKADWPRKTERDPEEYSDEEINALLENANDEERLLLKCFLCTALRSGELAHLTYGDIDFKHSVWTVRHKEDWNTKTENSHRDVPVPEWLTAKIKERMVASGRAKTDLIFFNRDGGPDCQMLRVVKRVAKLAKVTGRVDDHKFRSTAITRWLRYGNSVQDVMQWVGHKDMNTILRYAAALNVRKAETQQKASGASAKFAGVGD